MDSSPAGAQATDVKTEQYAFKNFKDGVDLELTNEFYEGKSIEEIQEMIH